MHSPAISGGLPEHTVKSYDGQLRHLHALIVRMGETVQQQLRDCLDAIGGDGAAARRVMAADPAVDALEREVDATVIRLLALRQPVAIDLRNIIAAMRISADLERAGDHAANVAKRTLVIARQASVPPLAGVGAINRMALEAMANVMAAFAAGDTAKAIDVWNQDDAIDRLYTGIFREILTYMMEDPRTITACTHLMFMAKNLERVGDHATNIAETVHYAITGAVLPDSRPKADASIGGERPAPPAGTGAEPPA